jgi:hypothetical protein
LSSAFSEAAFYLVEMVRIVDTNNVNINEVHAIESGYESIVTSLFGPGGDLVLNFNDEIISGRGQTVCFEQYATAFLEFRQTNSAGFFAFTASPPCCGSCSIIGGHVQVAYWPTPAPTPATSILVDEANNFT